MNIMSQYTPTPRLVNLSEADVASFVLKFRAEVTSLMVEAVQFDRELLTHEDKFYGYTWQYAMDVATALAMDAGLYPSSAGFDILSSFSMNGDATLGALVILNDYASKDNADFMAMVARLADEDLPPPPKVVYSIA